jgi:hypothetical protein
MRLRLALWGSLLLLQLLAIASPPDAIAPAAAGSVYVPLMVLRALGLPVFAAAESLGWQSPSLLGWAMVAVFWAIVWWNVVWLLNYLIRRRIGEV